MRHEPHKLHWYCDNNPVWQRFWFCHEGLGAFDFDYDTDTLRLVLSNKPFEGSIRATVSDEVSSNIDDMLTQLGLTADDTVYWKPELQTKNDGE